MAEQYRVPPPTDPVWQELLQGKKNVQFDFLAARMAVTMDRRKVARGGPEALKECARDLWRLFNENARLSVVQRDLQKLSEA
jgi:hypothetical protein